MAKKKSGGWARFTSTIVENAAKLRFERKDQQQYVKNKILVVIVELIVPKRKQENGRRKKYTELVEECKMQEHRVVRYHKRPFFSEQLSEKLNKRQKELCGLIEKH